ncbi:sulfatase [Myxococcota bacterium]|nr:sulfatase [Myxococcota bacterium]
MIRPLLTGSVRGATAGLVGGAGVGLGEAVAVVWSMAGTADRWALPYATVLYGLVGAAVGAVAGAGLALVAAVRGEEADAPRQFTLSLLAPFAPLGLVVLLWTLRRDVYAEQMPPKPVVVAVVAGWAMVSAAVYLLLSSATRKSFLSFLVHPVGALGTWGGLLVIALLGTIGGTPAGASDAPARGSVPPDLQDRPNVVLIMVDTLRADALGAYGHPGNPSPNIDAFARESVVFQQAIAQASWTRASTASLLTSMFPSSHNAYRKADVLAPEVETLPEVLLSKGYYSGALMNSADITRQFGFAQGFQSFAYLEPEPPLWGGGSAGFLSMYPVVRKLHERLATEMHPDSVYWDAFRVTEAATEWLARYGGERFFLFVHYMDPHDPYFRHPHDGFGYSRAENEDPGPSMAAELAKLYDGEVRYLDQHIEPLFRSLKQRGLWDDTVIVLTADHGVEFGEHGGFWHGTTLYDEQIRVPMIVKLPRQEQAGSLRPEVVRSIDVAPTVAALAGVAPDASWQGVSMLADWSQRAPEDRKAFSEEDFEGNRLRSLRGGDFKIILANEGNPRGVKPCELYEVGSDPGETRELCGSTDGAVETARMKLEQELSAAREHAAGRAVRRQETGMDAATCEKLKKLGYVDAGVDCASTGTEAQLR